MLAEIKNVFRPEFLNRVDEILVFNSLGRQELELIADNMLRELNQRLAGMVSVSSLPLRHASCCCRKAVTASTERVHCAELCVSWWRIR